MSKQTVVMIISLILAGFLAGVSVYQQIMIGSLNDQRVRESDILKASYDDLDSSYLQLLNSIQTVTDSMNVSLQIVTSLLDSSESELSSLQEDYLSLLESDNNLSDYYVSLSANLSEKIDDLKTSIAWLSQELGGYDGIFILNHSYNWGTVGMITTYTVTVELYNALEEANVTVKAYGDPGGSRKFTYLMPSYTQREYVEVWSGTAFYEDFSLITIESVERK